MTHEECLKIYVDHFGYKQLLFPEMKHKKSYIKNTKNGFLIIESLEESKIATFYFNDSVKKFKKSELPLCVLENIPAAWEAENE